MLINKLGYKITKNQRISQTKIRKVILLVILLLFDGKNSWQIWLRLFGSLDYFS